VPTEVPGEGRVAIRTCDGSAFEAILAIVNDAARAYEGVIPADRYHVPYMPADELRREIADGVRFWGWYEGGRLFGVMGIQDVDDVTLIRHAYVTTDQQGRGVGGGLLRHLLELAGEQADTGADGQTARRPLLVGTWAAAEWAIRFYERHGFELVTHDEKEELLRRYWRIPERQVETSVVLRFSKGGRP